MQETTYDYETNFYAENEIIIISLISARFTSEKLFSIKSFSTKFKRNSIGIKAKFYVKK